jgi:two-component system LytT family response regulator
MIPTIIIDDEKRGRNILSQLLQKHCNNVEVVALAESATQAKELVALHKPDLLFLDVEMPKQTGFDFLQSIKEKNFAVIFVTAHDQYAVKAFKFSALDFLLKPIDVDDLKNAVQKAEEKIRTSKPSEQLDVLKHHLKNLYNPFDKIGIPTYDGISFAAIHDIVRMEADVNYTNVFLATGEKYISSKSLKEFDDLLAELNFFRVHKSHLINLIHIKSYQKGDGGVVTLSDNSRVEVSRRHKDEFLARLSKL